MDVSGGSNFEKGVEHSSEHQVMVNTALIAYTEALEEEAQISHSKLSKKLIALQARKYSRL